MVVNKQEVGRLLVGRSKLGKAKVEFLAVALAADMGGNVLVGRDADGRLPSIA